MIKAAIVGMGWWGRTLVEAVADSEQIRVVAGATRTVSPEVKTFADVYRLPTAPRSIVPFNGQLLIEENILDTSHQVIPDS